MSWLPRREVSVLLMLLSVVAPGAAGQASQSVRELGQRVWAHTLERRMTGAKALAELGLNAVGIAEKQGRPAGSLPPTLREDGGTDAPRYLVDAQAVSAALEAAYRYVSALPEHEREAWLTAWWPRIEAAGSFVVGWTRGARGEPYPAWDPRFARDVGGPREAPGALLGVACAQELAGMAEKTAPDTWRQRREALEILVRTTDYTDGGRPDAVPPWGLPQLRGILPEEHPLWNARVRAGAEEMTAREWAWRDTGAPEQAVIREYSAEGESTRR